MTYNPALCRHLLRGLFPYTEIPARVSEAEAAAYRDRVRRQYTQLAKNWDRHSNSEWLIRYYLATEYILAASLLLASALYARSRKLHAALLYLIYYGLFQCCRAFMLTLPTQPWREGKLIILTHKKVAKIVADEIRNLNASIAKSVGGRLVDARIHREFFSYKFPGGGMVAVTSPAPVHVGEAIGIAAFLSELAQLNSEALDVSLITHCKVEVGYRDDIVDAVSVYATIDGQNLIDSEDRYRVDQLTRRQTRPMNIWAQAREGLIEDFFLNWQRKDDEEEHGFDPHTGWGLIFPFP